MPLKFEVTLDGSLGKGPSGFLESVEMKLAALAAAPTPNLGSQRGESDGDRANSATNSHGYQGSRLHSRVNSATNSGHVGPIRRTPSGRMIQEPWCPCPWKPRYEPCVSRVFGPGNETGKDIPGLIQAGFIIDAG
ncbi:MAG TPA: hypothetical protein VI756_06185, partial [Blastocatellia bacterium]